MEKDAAGNSNKKFGSRLRPDKLLQLTFEGYKWRKYGRKVLMEKTCVRSYYKCNHISITNCPAKKVIDIRDDDYARVVVSYIHEHNHPKVSLSHNSNQGQEASDESLSQESPTSYSGQEESRGTQNLGGFDEVMHERHRKTVRCQVNEAEVSIHATSELKALDKSGDANGAFFEAMSLLGGSNTASVSDYIDFPSDGDDK